MRLRNLSVLLTVPLLAVGAAATVAATPAEDAVFLYAQCDNPVVSTGTADLSTDDPGSLQAGNSCGWLVPVGSDTVDNNVTWSGNFEGAIHTVELRNHVIFGSAAHGQLFGQPVENDQPILLVIDGETVFDGVVSDLGRVQDTYVAVEFEYFIDLTELEIVDGEHTISVTFGHASADVSPIGHSGVYAWGSSDGVPGGLLINGMEPSNKSGTP